MQTCLLLILIVFASQKVGGRMNLRLSNIFQVQEWEALSHHAVCVLGYSLSYGKFP